MIKMEMTIEEKIYFNPGDIVKVRHEQLENVPVMYVLEKITRNLTTKDGMSDNVFLGIKCRYFDKNQVLREAIFSTKDLVHVY